MSRVQDVILQMTEGHIVFIGVTGVPGRVIVQQLNALPHPEDRYDMRIYDLEPAVGVVAAELGDPEDPVIRLRARSLVLLTQE